MKLIKSLVIVFALVLFVPRVYAFSYNMEMSGGGSVSSGDTKEIKVTLRNVDGIIGGVGACSMNISFDPGVTLNGSVTALNNWAVTVGSNYTFDTANAFVSNVEMFKIPVKITGNGSVRFTNIGCSDGETKEILSDVVVSFTIKQNNPSNNTPSNNPSNTTPNNNKEPDKVVPTPEPAKVTNIRLSEGEIQFNSDVFEYTVTVKDFTELNAYVDTTGDVEYNIEKNDGNEKNIVITVKSGDNANKTYTIKVIEELDTTVEDTDSLEEKKFNFVPIFIGIICILVFINVFRIVKNLKK